MPATSGRACSWSGLLEGLETANCQAEQLWGDREIPVGGTWLHVAQVGRQRRQAGLNAFAVAIPVEQRVHRERVAQIVNVSADRRLSPDASYVSELPKRDQNIRVQEASADDRDEKAGRFARRLKLVTQAGIGGQGSNGAGLQRDLARLAELGGPHHRQPLGPVKVGIVQSYRLADPHTGCC